MEPKRDTKYFKMYLTQKRGKFFENFILFYLHFDDQKGRKEKKKLNTLKNHFKFFSFLEQNTLLNKISSLLH